MFKHISSSLGGALTLPSVVPSDGPSVSQEPGDFSVRDEKTLDWVNIEIAMANYERCLQAVRARRLGASA